MVSHDCHKLFSLRFLQQLISCYGLSQVILYICTRISYKGSGVTRFFCRVKSLWQLIPSFYGFARRRVLLLRLGLDVNYDGCLGDAEGCEFSVYLSKFLVSPMQLPYLQWLGVLLRVKEIEWWTNFRLSHTQLYRNLWNCVTEIWTECDDDDDLMMLIRRKIGVNLMVWGKGDDTKCY